MLKKLILHLALISIVNILCLELDFSSIDSICKECFSMKSINNETKNLCSKNKETCKFQDMIQYIGERLMTAKKVAIAKWDKNDPIVDSIREEQVLETITKQSEDLGLDPFWAKMFFRDQMDANIYIQQRLHEVWNKTGSRPHGPAVDLVQIRPIIDKLNRDLINVSYDTKHIRNSTSCHLLLDMSTKKTTRNLRLDGVEVKAFKIAVKNVCL